MPQLIIFAESFAILEVLKIAQQTILGRIIYLCDLLEVSKYFIIIKNNNGSNGASGKAEKFNEIDFKSWQQKMLHLTTLSLERLLKEYPLTIPEKQFDPNKRETIDA